MRCGLNVVSSQNFYAEILTPKIMVLETWAIGRCLEHEGKALMNGISVLIKQTLEMFGPFSALREHREIAVYDPGRGSSPDTESACTFNWTS